MNPEAPPPAQALGEHTGPELLLPTASKWPWPPSLPARQQPAERNAGDLGPPPPSSGLSPGLSGGRAALGGWQGDVALSLNRDPPQPPPPAQESKVLGPQGGWKPRPRLRGRWSRAGLQRPLRPPGPGVAAKIAAARDAGAIWSDGRGALLSKWFSAAPPRSLFPGAGDQQ